MVELTGRADSSGPGGIKSLGRQFVHVRLREHDQFVSAAGEGHTVAYRVKRLTRPKVSLGWQGEFLPGTAHRLARLGGDGLR